MSSKNRESYMGARLVPADLAKAFRVACLEAEVSQKEVFLALMRDFVEHPQKWVVEIKKQKK